MNNSESILMLGECVTDWCWCNWLTALGYLELQGLISDIQNVQFAMKCHMNQWLPW